MSASPPKRVRSVADAKAVAAAAVEQAAGDGGSVLVRVFVEGIFSISDAGRLGDILLDNDAVEVEEADLVSKLNRVAKCFDLFLDLTHNNILTTGPKNRHIKKRVVKKIFDCFEKLHTDFLALKKMKTLGRQKNRLAHIWSPLRRNHFIIVNSNRVGNVHRNRVLNVHRSRPVNVKRVAIGKGRLESVHGVGRLLLARIRALAWKLYRPTHLTKRLSRILYSVRHDVRQFLRCRFLLRPTSSST